MVLSQESRKCFHLRRASSVHQQVREGKPNPALDVGEDRFEKQSSFSEIMRLLRNCRSEEFRYFPFSGEQLPPK